MSTGRTTMSDPSSEVLEHLTEADVAAYLDRGLSDSRRDRIEAHLAGCTDCRQEVLEAQQLVKRVRPFRRAPVWGGSLAAAAALVLIVAKLGSGPDRLPESPPHVRGDGGTPQLVVYGPIGDDVPTRGLRFVWSAAAGTVTYRFTMTGTDGSPVWSRSGTDTVVVLPDSVALRPGQRYLWAVDALLADGVTRSTGMREFVPGR